MGCSFSQIKGHPYASTLSKTIELTETEANNSKHYCSKKVDEEIEFAGDRDHEVGSSDSASFTDAPQVPQRRAMNAILLGAKGSGKTAIFNQFKLISGRTFDPFERRKYAQCAWAGMLRAIRLLLDSCENNSTVTKHYNENKPDLFQEWMEGNHLKSSNVLLDGDLFALGDSDIIHYFAALFPCHEEDKWMNSGNDKQMDTESLQSSLAVQNAAKLLQSTDLSLNAFRDKFTHVFANPQRRADTFENENMEISSYYRKQKNDQLKISQGGSFDGVLDSDKDTYNADLLRPTRQLLGRSEASRAELAAAIYLLWEACPTPLRFSVGLNETDYGANIVYFMQQIAAFVNVDYDASDNEVIRGRVNDTNNQIVVLADFNNDMLFLTDLHNSRFGRKMFAEKTDLHTSCIMYVLNVASFDQPSEEFTKLTGLEEAFLDLKSLSETIWIRPKVFHVLMNKVDVLAEKCKSSLFSEHYPSYSTDNNNPDEIMDYIEERVRSLVLKRTKIFFHRICAVDMAFMRDFAPALSDTLFAHKTYPA